MISVSKTGRFALLITLIILVLGVWLLVHHQQRTPDVSEKLHHATSESRSTVGIGAKTGTKPSRNPRTDPGNEVLPARRPVEQKQARVPEGTHGEVSAELRKESELAASIDRLFDTSSEEPTAQEDSGGVSTGWCTVTIRGVEYFLKPGDVLEIVEVDGTANPRPRTPEEQRRYDELAEELQRFDHLNMSPEDRERYSKLKAEVDRINAETLPLSYTTHRVSFTITKNPEGSIE